MKGRSDTGKGQCFFKNYGRKVPLEWIPYDRTPVYDLDSLAQEVISEMFGGSFDGIACYQWTDKAYKGFFGRYFHESRVIEISTMNQFDIKEW